MSTALNMWMLLPQISDNSLHLGRDDIFYRIEGLRRKYSNAAQLLDSPMTDLPRYRGLLQDSSDLLTFVYQEGEKMPELVQGVDFSVASASYSRLIDRMLKGEVTAGALANNFIKDGEFGTKIFEHLSRAMEQEGFDIGNLKHTAYEASLGSENPHQRQVSKGHDSTPPVANSGDVSTQLTSTAAGGLINSTAGRIWSLFPKVMERATALGRKDVLQGIAYLEEKYRGKESSLSDPRSDMVAYREILKDSMDFFQWLVAEGSKSRWLLQGVDVTFPDSSYSDLARRWITGEVKPEDMREQLHRLFEQDGETGIFGPFNNVHGRMAGMGANNDFMRLAIEAQQGFDNFYQLQLKKLNRQKLPDATDGNDNI